MATDLLGQRPDRPRHTHCRPTARTSNPLAAPCHHRPSWDLLFAATLVTLLVPLAEMKANGWPTWTWLVLACAPIVVCLTILVERRFESRGGVPLLPPSLLRIRSMRRGLVLQCLFMLSYGAFMFVFALTVQDGLHRRVPPAAASPSSRWPSRSSSPRCLPPGRLHGSALAKSWLSEPRWTGSDWPGSSSSSPADGRTLAC